MELYREPLLVSNVVAEVVRTVEPLAAQKNIDLVGDPGAGGVVVADVGRVRQILFNLLSNAIKFTPDGGTVTVQCAPRPGYRAHHGRRHRHRSQPRRIRQRCSRSSTSSTRPRLGGMRAAWGWCSRSDSSSCTVGGSGWRAGPARGAASMSPCPAGERTSGWPSPDNGRRTTSGRAGRSRTPGLDPSVELPLILVVEDDAAAAKLMCAYLARGGYRFEVATDGLEAILKAEALRPMAITLDIMLPGSMAGASCGASRAIRGRATSRSPLSRSSRTSSSPPAWAPPTTSSSPSIVRRYWLVSKPTTPRPRGLRCPRSSSTTIRTWPSYWRATWGRRLQGRRGGQGRRWCRDRSPGSARPDPARRE